MLRARTIPLGTWRGCALRIDPALPLGLGYLGWILVDRYRALRALGPAVHLGSAVLLALGVAAAALASVLFHEAAHAAAARLFGGQTRRLTLSLLGGRTTIAGSLGVEWRAALVGPFVSLTVGILVLAIAGQIDARRADAGLALVDLAHFNLGLGLVNLLPILPLDGGRALRALAAERMGSVAAARLASRVGQAFGLVLVALAIADRRMLLLFVALAVIAGALVEEQDSWLAGPIGGLLVRDAMRPGAWGVPGREPLATAARLLASAGVSAVPVVTSDGRPLGAVSPSALQRARRAARDHLDEVAGALGGVVASGARLADVRRQMRARRAGAVAVVDETGALSGVLSLAAIDRRIRLEELAREDRTTPTYTGL